MKLKTIAYSLLFSIFLISIYCSTDDDILKEVSGTTELLVKDGSIITVKDLISKSKKVIESDFGSATIRIPADTIVKNVDDDEGYSSETNTSDSISLISLFAENPRFVPSLVVLKDFTVDRSDHYKIFCEAKNEYGIMKLLVGCKSIPKPYYLLSGIVDKNPFVGIVMENIDGDNMANLCTEQYLNEETLHDYSSQLVHVTHYMHSKLVVHFDIKPGNIMISKSGKLFLIDFGLSKKFNDPSRGVSFSKAIGTSHYWSPELYVFVLFRTQLKKPPKFSIKTLQMFDVFALGMSLITAYLGRNPIPSLKSPREFIEAYTKLFEQLDSGVYPLSVEAVSFLKRCIYFDTKVIKTIINGKPELDDAVMEQIYNGRATLKELLTDPWIIEEGFVSERGNSIDEHTGSSY